MNAALVDSNAFVALLDRSDRNHERCVEAMTSVPGPLVTVWPVVTESMYLVERLRRGPDSLFELILELVARKVLSIVDLDASDMKRMKALMAKYRDLPMDFADAALVRVAERDKLTRILTFDHHFSVYSLPGRARFVILGSSSSLER